MDTKLETLIMTLIVESGSAKSFAMEAISLAKDGNIKEARDAIDKSTDQLSDVHKLQTDLIQQEAKGNHTEINLFMVHAQDHLMTSMLARDMAREFVDLYEKMEQSKL